MDSDSQLQQHHHQQQQQQHQQQQQQQSGSLFESQMEVIKHNSELRITQDSEIRSVNFSIILTDDDGNPIIDASDDDVAATESIMNSELSRSSVTTPVEARSLYTPMTRQVLTRQPAITSLG